METVCALDGVPVLASRAGPLVHIDEIPKGVDAHDVEHVMDRETWDREQGIATKLKGAITDMVLHHQSIHPASDCQHLRVLQDAAKLL